MKRFGRTATVDPMANGYCRARRCAACSFRLAGAAGALLVRARPRSPPDCVAPASVVPVDADGLDAWAFGFDDLAERSKEYAVGGPRPRRGVSCAGGGCSIPMATGRCSWSLRATDDRSMDTLPSECERTRAASSTSSRPTTPRCERSSTRLPIDWPDNVSTGSCSSSPTLAHGRRQSFAASASCLVVADRLSWPGGTLTGCRRPCGTSVAGT